MFLLDSCVCIDFLRGNLKKGYDLMCKSDPRLFKIPSVVQAELLLGAAKSNNPDTNRFFVEQFLLPFDILPFDSRCAREYVSIRSYLEKEGKKIGLNNLMIASIARAHNAVLVTHNMREFKRVPGIELEDWAEVVF